MTSNIHKVNPEESRGTGTCSGQEFLALVSYSCVCLELFFFFLFCCFFFVSWPSVSENFLIQMEIFANDKQIFHYRAIESHPHRWTGAAQEEINVCVRDGFSADHRPVNEPSCTSVTVSPEGNVNVRLEVRAQTLRLQFRHTCIFPSALSSQDEDCLNKRPLVCVCVCVHTPCAISLVLMRAVLNV